MANAKDREEHDEVVEVVTWLRVKGIEAERRGERDKSVMLAVSASRVADLFILDVSGGGS